MASIPSFVCLPRLVFFALFAKEASAAWTISRPDWRAWIVDLCQRFRFPPHARLGGTRRKCDEAWRRWVNRRMKTLSLKLVAQSAVVKLPALARDTFFVSCLFT